MNTTNLSNLLSARSLLSHSIEDAARDGPCAHGNFDPLPLSGCQASKPASLYFARTARALRDATCERSNLGPETQQFRTNFEKCSPQ